MALAAEIASLNVKKGEIAVFWLGQAGFVIKDGEGTILAIDPYLTDCVERIAGFKRLSPRLLAPDELEPDLLLTSHDHPDHFDVDAVPQLMANGRTRLLGSVTAAGMALDMGIDRGRITAMKPGDTMQRGSIRIKAVFADHGELAPDALGFMLTLGDIKVYYAADTAYHPQVVKTAREEKPDIILVPINGQYGNLSEQEAAWLARDSGAKVAVPCHFWTFIIHRGDPQLFADAMKRDAPACAAKFLYQGEMFQYSALTP